MPKHKDNSTWKGKATDIAYKEPFSDSTNKTRKLLTFWAPIALLNHFYQIDLQNSHVLGLKFAKGVVPPLNGLLGLLVCYLTITLGVYVYQEIKSWLAQANEVALVEYRRSLHDIYAHYTGIHDSVNGATTQLESHTAAVLKLRDKLGCINKEHQDILEKNLNEIELHKQSFLNFVHNLGNYKNKYGEEVVNAQTILKKVESDYSAALKSQIVKVGILEVILPFSLGIFAVIYSRKDVFNLLLRFF